MRNGGTGDGEEGLVEPPFPPRHHQALHGDAAHHVLRADVDGGDEGPLGFGRHRGDRVPHAAL